MSGDAKRKGAPGASPDADGRAAKRQKVPGNAVETPESTTEAGLEFLRRMKAAKDKTGRPIADPFLTLPGPGEVPGYYEEIKMPLALDTIEAKLHQKAYANLAALESDVKRMVTNAKTFNEKTSATYLDAERLRKTASNWMTENNPAYRIPGYAATATPIPGEAVPTPTMSAKATPTPAATAQSLKIRGPNPSRTPSARHAPAPTPSRTSRSSARDANIAPAAASARSQFAGMSFQQAQEHIVDSLVDKVEDDIQVYEPFVSLPNREIKEYYRIIKTPVSLNQIKKRIQGVTSRNPATGHTIYGGWDALTEDISGIWRNARTFNEDGSDLFELANELEDEYTQLLAEAKQHVQEPPQPAKKLRINAPKQAPSIKLRFGARGSPNAGSPAPSTPAGRSSATPGVIVDSAALARQQQYVQSSVNGQKPIANAGRSASASSPRPMSGQRNEPSPPIAVNGVKSESHAPSPALAAIRPMSNGNLAPSTLHYPQGSMAPPSMLPHGASNSPHPYPGAAPAVQPAQPYYPPRPPTENRNRTPGTEIILPNIQLSTNPALLRNGVKCWKYNIPADPRLLQQQVSVTLPSTQYSLEVMPTIPVANTSRPYRIFVHVNGSQITQAIRPGVSDKRDRAHQPFDVKLVTGVNRIDIELLAAAELKKGQTETNEMLKEMCTIYVHLLRP